MGLKWDHVRGPLPKIARGPDRRILLFERWNVDASAFPCGVQKRHGNSLQKGISALHEVRHTPQAELT